MTNTNAMTDASKLENGRCKDCGKALGAGYLCDACDTLEIHD